MGLGEDDLEGGDIELGGDDEFGGDDLAFEILHRFDGRGFGHGEHPAHLAEALLGVDEIGDFDDLGAGLLDPVEAGETGVEHAVFDVAGHLLGADEHALDFRIVDDREVGAAGGLDMEAGLPEQIDGGVFEGAFGDTEFELVRHGDSYLV